MLNHAQREFVALAIASGSIIGLVHTVTPAVVLRLSGRRQLLGAASLSLVTSLSRWGI